LDVAFAAAQREPLPPVAQRFDSPHVRLLVALCHQLQVAAGDRSFYLACRSVARLLGCDAKAAWRLLWLLEREGIVKRVATGCLPLRKANTLRFLSDV
jgi:hypothetical protein